MAKWLLLVIVSNVWRREIFPNYKAGRKANRAKSEHDWSMLYLIYISKVKNEIKAFLPYKVIELETAEADDIIAVLVRRQQTVIGPNHAKESINIIR